MAEIRFCSSLHCVQNLNSGFFTPKDKNKKERRRENWKKKKTY